MEDIGGTGDRNIMLFEFDGKMSPVVANKVRLEDLSVNFAISEVGAISPDISMSAMIQLQMFGCRMTEFYDRKIMMVRSHLT